MLPDGCCEGLKLGREEGSFEGCEVGKSTEIHTLLSEKRRKLQMSSLHDGSIVGADNE